VLANWVHYTAISSKPTPPLLLQAYRPMKKLRLRCNLSPALQPLQTNSTNCSIYNTIQQLLLARLMGQYCFASWRLSSSVMRGNRAADTARRASTVTSRYGDTLFVLCPLQVDWRCITQLLIFIAMTDFTDIHKHRVIYISVNYCHL